MSCGKPHEIDCSQILNEVYLFLDLECADDRRAAIQHHLDECSSCLREYGIEQDVRAIVARCCGGDRVVLLAGSRSSVGRDREKREP